MAVDEVWVVEAEQRSGAQPKWQRAVIIDGEVPYEKAPLFYQLLGQELWLEIGPPKAHQGRSSDGFSLVYVGHFSHVIAPNGDPMGWPASLVKLLARDADDFADHVEPIALDDWLAAIRAERAGAQ